MFDEPESTSRVGGIQAVGTPSLLMTKIVGESTPVPITGFAPRDLRWVGLCACIVESKCGIFTESMTYRIALEKTDEGYSVHVPGLPGCWSQGDTEDEAIANIKEAISEYLSVRDELLRGADIREVDIPV